jgi:carnitine O-palmitoyltransferase 2
MKFCISGNIFDPSYIYANIKYILSDDRPPAEHPVGLLTTQDRDIWASQRHHLLQMGNERIMKIIDTAIFNLVLDEEHFNDDYDKLLRSYLHSDGCNRFVSTTMFLSF